MNKNQLKQLEDDLWSAADNLRANTDLKSSEYVTPVLGLIFLKFADNKYSHAEAASIMDNLQSQAPGPTPEARPEVWRLKPEP